MKKRYLEVVIVVGLIIAFSVSFAGQAESNALLARINHELDIIKPLINQAQAEAIKNQRIVFHYDWLRSDINHIQDGINEKLNQSFIKNLAEKLLLWTGERWIISLSKNNDARSIYEKNWEKKSSKLEEFKNSDLARQIEKAFPDAKLIDIQEDNND